MEIITAAFHHDLNGLLTGKNVTHSIKRLKDAAFF